MQVLRTAREALRTAGRAYRREAGHVVHHSPPDDDGPPAGFEVTTEHQEDVARVGARGDLDLGTAATLCSHLTEAIQRPAGRIILDLSEIVFCDSTGLRAIIGVVREVS